MNARVRTTGALLLMVLCSSAMAQNKVRDERFAWQAYRTEHFDVHFYGDDMLPRAREVGGWLENSRVEIERTLHVKPPDRVPVFLYRTHNHFEQTNLYPSVPEGVGAFADATRDRVVIPAYPSERYMQTVLQHELVHIFQYATVYPYRVPSYLFLTGWLHPSWLIEGMADHLAPPRDSDADMRLRDSALDDTLRPVSELRGFAHLNPHEIRAAYEEGAFFLEYLDGRTDGRATANLLAMLGRHIAWNFDAMFAGATGMAFRDADRDFREDAARRWAGLTRDAGEPDGFYVTTEYDLYRVYNQACVWNPTDESILYLSDRGEFATPCIVTSDRTYRRTLLRGKLNSSIDSVKRGNTGLSWFPDGRRICFIGERVNREYLFVLDTETGDLERHELPFDEIASPDVSPDGTRVALSAVRAGVSDIAVYDLGARRTRLLTEDRAHDESPRWSPDGGRIAYSSERGGQTDLFIVTVDRTASRLTDTPWLERHPSWSPDGARLAYSSDAGGISNIHVMNLADRTVRRLTKVVGGAFSPSFSPDGARLVFSYHRHGSQNLCVIDATGPALAMPATADAAAREVLEQFTTEPSEGVVSEFNDHMGLDLAIPLLILNPFTFSDLRGDHEISGDISPLATESGTIVLSELSWWNRAHRADIALGWFSQYESSSTIEDFLYGVQARAAYPFDHKRSAVVGLVGYRRDRYQSGSMTDGRFESGVRMELIYDNRFGRGLDITGGTLYGASATAFLPGLGSEREFTSYSLDHERYIALTRDQVLAFTLSADISEGPQPEAFDLALGVRGIEPNTYEAANRFAATIEYRFPLFRDVNVPLAGSYLMLKDIRGYLFGDAGFARPGGFDGPFSRIGGAAWHESAGVGLRFDLYGLQQLGFSGHYELQSVDGSWQSGWGVSLDLDF